MILRIRKRPLLCGFEWEENPEKVLRQWKKVSMSWKRNLFICVFEGEKINNFEIIANIFKTYKKCKSSIQNRILKGQKILSKTSFYLYFRDTPKNGEWSKWDVDSICVRVTKDTSKKVAKVEGNLDWLWTIEYGLFWLYIHIHERCSLFDANFVTIFMISLFLAAPVPRVRRAWNLMGTSVRNGPRFFLLFGKTTVLYRS